MNKNADSRVTEIQKLIAANDLTSAVKRLMDFVDDFAVNRKRKHEVILISREYNELNDDMRMYGKTEGNIKKATRLSNQILEFSDAILDENIVQQNVADNEMPTDSAPKSNHDITIDPEIHAEATKLEVEKTKFLQDQKLKSLSASKVVLDGKGITKTHKSKTLKFVLQPINLKLKLGEITGIVGENGSGKTTLLEVIAGLSMNSGGELEYPCLRSNPDYGLYNVRQQIAYIPQELPMWCSSLADTLHFSAAIHGIRGKENEIAVEFIINRMGLHKYKYAKWHELSSGYKMRFSLAKMLIWHPKLVVLDEPLANLDINTQSIFLQDLRNLANSVRHPMAIIASSQHLHQIESIADNIIFMKEGQTLYNGSVSCFGEDRRENSYEIDCNYTIGELKGLLEGISYTKIESLGRTFIIHTSRDVNYSDILKVLLEANVKIKFFRDISKSTRKLFRSE